MTPRRAVLLLMLALGASSGPAWTAESDPNPFAPKSSTTKSGGGEAGASASHLPGDAPTVPWSGEATANGKARCAKLLAGLAIEYQALPPIKEGLCGAPAPILVRSIGADPKVAIDPPATITCPLAAALVSWLETKVQPAARAAFDAPVVKLKNAASYACRNRYGGANTPISEHALANALDISDFVIESGEHVTVLSSWPKLVATVPPLPEPNPSRVAESTGAIAPPPPPAPKPAVSRVTAAGVNVVEVMKVKSNPFVLPTPLPAPELDPSPVAEPEPPTAPLAERKSAFVREVHDDACKMFGTTLGPEANEAHKSHFHLDMKARRSGFCE